MANSRHIARLLGPTLLALTLTESINLDIWTETPLPVVYISGTLLFVSGLSIIRAHNHWTASWPVLVNHDTISMDTRAARDRERFDFQSLLSRRNQGKIREPDGSAAR